MCKGGNVKREKYEILKERNIKCLKGEMGNVKREKSSCKSAATGDTIATFSDTLSPVSVAATSWEFPEIYHPFLNSQHISFFLSFFKIFYIHHYFCPVCPSQLCSMLQIGLFQLLLCCPVL